MASGLFDMLSDLAKHPAKLNDFKKNPDTVMEGYALTIEQKKHIKSAVHDSKHHDFFKAVGDELHEQFTDPDVVFC